MQPNIRKKGRRFAPSPFIFSWVLAQAVSWPRSAPHDCPCAALPGLSRALPIVTAALGCVPSLRCAAKRPRNCVSFVPNTSDSTEPP